MDIPGIKYRIVKHLPAYLLKYGFVDMEGLGRFRLEAHTSFIDHAKALVYPPYYDVKFDAGQYSQVNDYIAYLSKRLGLDDALISEVMMTYTTSLRQQLDSHETVNLEGLGTLLVQEDLQIKFESDEVFWGKTAIQDLAVSFNPVPRLKDQVQKQMTSNISDDLVSDDAPAIAELEVTEELIEDQFEESWEESSELEVTEASLEESFAISSDVEIEAESVQPVIEVPEPSEEVLSTPVDNTRVETVLIEGDLDGHERDEKRHRIIFPLMIGLLILAVPLFWYLVKDHDVSSAPATEIPENRLNKNPEEVAPVEETTPAIVDQGADNTSKETEASNQETNAKAKDIVEEAEEEAVAKEQVNTEYNNQSNRNIESNLSTVTSGDCIIIVGAYSQSGNMQNMMSKLEAQGFKVYVDSSRSLSRVGAYSTCQSDELQKNLDIIQSNIEPSSWILK